MEFSGVPDGLFQLFVKAVESFQANEFAKSVDELFRPAVDQHRMSASVTCQRDVLKRA